MSSSSSSSTTTETFPAFYDLAEFPALVRLSQQWEIIRDELRALHVPVLDIDRVGKGHEVVYAELVQSGKGSGWLKGWTKENEANTEWLSYPLTMMGKTALDIPQRMPRTIALVGPMPGVKVCAFNKLKPHTLLSTHTHDELRPDRLLQYHLCLEADEKLSFNYFNVNGEFRQQKPGTAYAFDGSYPHFAVNATDQDRIILYMEFWMDRMRAT